MIFVGPFSRKPAEVPRAHFLDEAHPRDMAKILKERGGDWWTNQPYAVDGFEADEVTVLTASGPKLLSAHPDWSAWNKALKSGEFWSYVGEEW